MSAGIAVGLLVVMILGCGGQDLDYGPKDFARPDSGSGAGTDGDADGDADGDQDAYAPEVIEAVIAHPAPEPSAWVRLDDGLGRNPALFAIDGQWFAFFTQGEWNGTSPLKVRTSSAEPLAFGEPATLLYGAVSVDLVQDQERLLAIAARIHYTVLLESLDGAEWTELGNIAPDEPTYNCWDYPPVRFFRGAAEAAFLAMGNDLNTGIFGCTDRVFFAERNGSAWAVPWEVAPGDAVFGYHGTERLILVSTFGIFESTDQGETFLEQRGGDTTASQLEGTGGAVVGDRLIVVQTYNYANAYFIAALVSDDQGATWPRKIVLDQGSDPYGPPIAASDGDHLAVAYRSAMGLEVMTSPDRGETWSEPGPFIAPDPDAGSAVGDYAIAVMGSRVGVLCEPSGVWFAASRGPGRASR